MLTVSLSNPYVHIFYRFEHFFDIVGINGDGKMVINSKVVSQSVTVNISPDPNCGSFVEHISEKILKNRISILYIKFYFSDEKKIRSELMSHRR